ncbi:MAG: hypothetical protein CVU38_19450, partial [Chloroflexi bacterium HGW-Chloroflexi-1]
MLCGGSYCRTSPTRRRRCGNGPVKVELTPFQQSQPYTCVAACLRVVLAALGVDYPEDDLARACNTAPSGATLSDAAHAVRSLG